jgi:hypothetical protein
LNSCLAFITIYHIATFFDTVSHYLLPNRGALGDFIVWMPIYLAFIFLTLGVKKGLSFSILIFLLTLVDGLIYIIPAVTGKGAINLVFLTA